MTIFYWLLSIIALFMLILFSAFTSASEVAVLASSRVRLYHLAKKGNTKASIVMSLQSHIGGFIGSVILLNTWFNTLVTALGTGVMTYLFGPKCTFTLALNVLLLPLRLFLNPFSRS